MNEKKTEESKQDSIEQSGSFPLQSGVKGRVELLKTLAPKQLPVGSKGTLLEGRIDEPGMVVVQWDAGFTILMYRNEIKAL